MPAYTTIQKMTDRYGQKMLVDLTDREDPRTGAIVAEVVDRAVTDAAAVIDGYLKGRYALPLTEVPDLIGDIAAALVIWKLHPYEPSGKIETDYKEAMRQLGDIARGVIGLPLPDGSEAAGTGGTGAKMTDRERPFTENTMKGYI